MIEYNVSIQEYGIKRNKSRNLNKLLYFINTEVLVDGSVGQTNKYTHTHNKYTHTRTLDTLSELATVS